MRHRKATFIILFAMIVAIIGPASAQDDEHYTIAYFLFSFTNPFKVEMAELGYIEGENTTYLAPSYVGYETMTMEEAMADSQRQIAEILAAGPDIIITNTDTDAVFYQTMAGETPIVFARSDDPVATGAVADLVNPGGLMTGNITNRPHERRLQVLTEIKPETKKIYYLYSTMTGEAEIVREQVEIVGAELGVEVVLAPITDVASALELLENAPEDIDWLFLTPFVPFDLEFYAKLSEVSLSRKAGIAGVIDQPTQGYVVGYGPSLDDSDRQTARIADRILRGASPADLPVQTSENYLTVNLEAAAAIELEIPEGILRQANTIVRPGYFDNLPQFGAPPES